MFFYILFNIRIVIQQVMISHHVAACISACLLTLLLDVHKVQQLRPREHLLAAVVEISDVFLECNNFY